MGFHTNRRRQTVSIKRFLEEFYILQTYLAAGLVGEFIFFTKYRQIDLKLGGVHGTNMKVVDQPVDFMSSSVSVTCFN